MKAAGSGEHRELTELEKDKRKKMTPEKYAEAVANDIAKEFNIPQRAIYEKFLAEQHYYRDSLSKIVEEAISEVKPVLEPASNQLYIEECTKSVISNLERVGLSLDEEHKKAFQDNFRSAQKIGYGPYRWQHTMGVVKKYMIDARKKAIALGVAIEHGGALEAHINKGASLNMEFKQDREAFIKAAITWDKEKNTPAMLAYLLEQDGGVLGLKGEHIQDALAAALRSQSFECAKWLVENHHVKLDVSNKKHKAAFIKAASKDASGKNLGIISECFVEVNQDMLNAALKATIEDRKPKSEAFKQLINAGAEITDGKYLRAAMQRFVRDKEALKMIEETRAVFKRADKQFNKALEEAVGLGNSKENPEKEAEKGNDTQNRKKKIRSEMIEEKSVQSAINKVKDNEKTHKPNWLQKLLHPRTNEETLQKRNQLKAVKKELEKDKSAYKELRTGHVKTFLERKKDKGNSKRDNGIV